MDFTNIPALQKLTEFVITHVDIPVLTKGNYTGNFPRMMRYLKHRLPGWALGKKPHSWTTGDGIIYWKNPPFWKWVQIIAYDRVLSFRCYFRDLKSRIPSTERTYQEHTPRHWL